MQLDIVLTLFQAFSLASHTLIYGVGRDRDLKAQIWHCKTAFIYHHPLKATIVGRFFFFLHLSEQKEFL